MPRPKRAKGRRSCFHMSMERVRTAAFRRGSPGETGDRAGGLKGDPLARSGHVLSETAGARVTPRLILDPRACIDGEDRCSMPAPQRRARVRFEPLVRRVVGRRRGTGLARASLETASRRVPGSSVGRQVKPAGRSRPANRREPVDRAEKSELVATLNEVFTNTGVVVVAHYSGLTVADMPKLRGADEAGRGQRQGRQEPPRQDRSRRHGRREHIRTCSRARRSSPIRTIRSRRRRSPSNSPRANDKFVMLGGAMGETTLDADGVKALATLPSLDELRAKLVGMIQTPGDPDRAGRQGARRRSLPACSGPTPRRDEAA